MERIVEMPDLRRLHGVLLAMLYSVAKEMGAITCLYDLVDVHSVGF